MINSHETTLQTPSLLDQFEFAQDMLAAHPQVGSFSERVEQDTLVPEQEAKYGSAADDIFDTLGIPAKEVIDSWETTSRENIGTPSPVLRLRRAADAALTASAFGFDLHGPEESLRSVTATMLEDIDTLRTRAANDAAYRESREYSQISKVLILLAESGVRELGRRNNLGDSLTASNLTAVQEATGVRIIKSKPGATVFSSIITSRHQAQRLQPETSKDGQRIHTSYYLPHLAGPNVPSRTIDGKSGWVPARIGSFVLDARYTGNKLPMD